MSIRTQLVALALVLAAAAVLLYGRYERRQGWNERDTAAQIEEGKLLAKARDTELAAQENMEKVQNDALEHKRIADAAIAAASADLAGLRRTIASQAARLKAAGATTGTDAIASACWIALDESVQRYSDVAGIADGYVERLRIGQGWADVIQKAKPQ